MTDRIETSDVTFERGGDELRAYAARPAGAGPFPGLVLIHDVRGLYEHYRDVARRFAGAGFFTLAVDLYSREGAPELRDMESVFRWMRELPDRRVIADLQAAVDFAASLPQVRADAVGITGFCMGGQYALMAACSVERLAACVSWYGMLRYPQKNETKPADALDMASRLSCPYLGLFGADDGLIPLADVEELRSILGRERKTFEIEIYPGAGHAFFNDARADAFRPEVASRAWERAVGFLRHHLV
jgi:carboxymethylenebutenolidase